MASVLSSTKAASCSAIVMMDNDELSSSSNHDINNFVKEEKEEDSMVSMPRSSHAADHSNDEENEVQHPSNNSNNIASTTEATTTATNDRIIMAPPPSVLPDQTSVATADCSPTAMSDSTIGNNNTSLNQQLELPTTSTTESISNSPTHTAPPTPTNLLCLPLDALHSIASFLTPYEFVHHYMTLNHQSRQLGRMIVSRAYRHAYQCLCEIIVSYQYYQQYEDCHELAALYLQNGVPIYPYSLGHAYHTVYWKMNIEMRQQQQHQEHPVVETSLTGTIPEDGHGPDRHPKVMDPFYGPARIQHRRGRNYTYMEEKCHFYVERGLTSNGDDEDEDDDDTSPPHRHRSTNNDTTTTATTNTSPAAAATAASSSSTTNRTHAHCEIPVSLHQHLHDRHTIHYEYFVDIQNGTMTTPPIHLSADFFHPTITKMSQSRASSCAVTNQPTTPSPTAPTDESLNHNTTHSITPQNTTNEESIVSSTTQLQQSPSLVRAISGESTVVEIVDHANIVGVGDRTNDIDDLAPLVENEDGATANAAANTLSALSSSVSLCHVEVYSLATMISDTAVTNQQDELRKHLLSRFRAYQRRIETYLGKGDIYAYEECMLDVWDEFFPHTAGIHYYDLETPVPRMSHLHQFVTKPCPAAIGTVQCEIERIKITPRGKGVKGRLFPIYEYRLFIRHRQIRSKGNSNSNIDGEIPAADDGDDDNNNNTERNSSNANFVRRDTVLMVAKNRGRKYTEPNASSSTTSSSSVGGIIPFSHTNTKKGSNNYYLYLAQQMDIDDHFRNCNQHLIESNIYSNDSTEPNGASRYPLQLCDFYDRNMLLGRLQSNFIGTEFQIFVPRIQRFPRTHVENINNKSRYIRSPPFHSDEEIDYDSGMSSDNNNTVRRSRFSRFRRSAFSSTSSNGTMTTASSTNHPNYSTNSDSGSVVTTMTTPTLEHRAIKRALSSPENLSSYRTTSTMGHQLPQRHSRLSRRIIANDSNSSPSPQRQSPPSAFLFEEEAGVITYTANLLGSRPRIMDVCIPKVSPDGTVGLEWRQYVESCYTGDDDNNNTVDEGCRMLSCFRQIQHRRDNNPPDQPPQVGVHNMNNAPATTNHAVTETDGDHSNGGATPADQDFGLLALQNRPPWWNAELGSFVLNFGGRVSVASVKNFQLCIRSDPDATIMLQFGRIHGGRHSFTMDYSHPLTTVQAFSIAVSSLQSKISFG